MNSDRKNDKFEAKLKAAKDLPVFSDSQIAAFNSTYVDSLDEALAVLDETNRAVIGPSKTLSENKGGH